MSLKDRLNRTSGNIVNSENSYDLLFQTGEVSVEYMQLKERIHSLLIEKVNSTPTWINFSDDEQKELIKEYIARNEKNNKKEIRNSRE